MMKNLSKYPVSAIVIIALLVTVVTACGSPAPAPAPAPKPAPAPSPTPAPAPAPAPTPPPAAKEFALSVVISPPEGGTVTPAGGNFSPGSSVSLTAKAAAGYDFTGWSGDASGASLTINLTMDAPKKVTATFAKSVPSYSLTITVNPPGSATVTPASGKFTAGTLLELKATPATGFEFGSWSGDISGSSPTVSLRMDGDKNITVNMKSGATHVLRVTLIPHEGGVVAIRGAVTGEVGTGVIGASNFTVNSGASVSLTASAMPGYDFAYWSGDASGSNPTVTIDMNSDKNVIANFKVTVQRVDTDIPAGPTKTGWIILTRTMRANEKVSGTIWFSLDYLASDRAQTATMQVMDPEGNQILGIPLNWYSDAPRAYNFTTAGAGEYKIKISHESQQRKQLHFEIAPGGWYLAQKAAI